MGKIGELPKWLTLDVQILSPEWISPKPLSGALKLIKFGFKSLQVYYKTKRWVWALGLFSFSTTTLNPAFNEFILNNDEQIIVIDRDKKIKADVIFIFGL